MAEEDEIKTEQEDQDPLSQSQQLSQNRLSSAETTSTSSNGSIPNPVSGDASSAIFLLRDYSKFGLAERVCYHFDLTEALMKQDIGTTNDEIVDSEKTASSMGYESSIKAEDPVLIGSNTRKDGEHDEGNNHSSRSNTCGVSKLLEFAPTTIWHRLTRRQKRSLRTHLRAFNLIADSVHNEGKTLCYQPKEIPLRCNPSTRIYFGYEVTRIAFCVDASPSLTSTFGITGRKNTTDTKYTPLCPLDRLPEMARIFFSSLVEPVTSATLTEPWRPRFAVTVLAVYPMGATSETSLLVRDHLVHDIDTARMLIEQIEKWTYSDVECGISERLCRRQASNMWSVPIYSSSLRHILEAGDYALNVLSSEARPVVVVATDGRSVSCEGIVDVFLDVDRVDIPIHVLDLSLPETHAVAEPAANYSLSSSKNELNFLSFDPGGNMDFPLHLTDDSEAIFVVCRATGGCFLDFHLLSEAAKSTAGQQAIAEESIQQSHSFKRRFVKMNGLQWLCLFSLSPISPTFHASWGKLVPPLYLQKQINRVAMEGNALVTSSNISPDIMDLSRHQSSSRQALPDEHHGVDGTGPLSLKQSGVTRTTFSTYIVSPVRIKALLLMRIKEGFRAKQYGLSTNDPDKVFIQFTLPLEFGIVVHYELSYKAISSRDHMVGSAHIKIEISGDHSFIQTVKNDFLRQTVHLGDSATVTLRQKKSARLCQTVRQIRRDDILQSYLKPPQKWSDQLNSPSSPFAKRLDYLSSSQRKRHFQCDQFDVVCTGVVPYGLDDNFLSQFLSTQDGTQELVYAISDWSSLALKPNVKFVKRFLEPDKSTNYFVIEILESDKASRLFTINVEFFGGTDPIMRLEVLASLKKEIDGLKHVEVLTKQMAPFLVGNANHSLVKGCNVAIQFHHASWDLVKDPELMALLTKRRIEIGSFRLLESRDDYALFAKLVPTSDHASPDDLVQYQIAVHEDKVVIDLHMESESSVFNPYHMSSEDTSHFCRMMNLIRRRDQECGRALRSRTNLLRALDTSNVAVECTEDHRSSVERILAYSSRVTRKLRFFTSSGGVNDILTQLTADLMLSEYFGVQSAKLNIDAREIVFNEMPGLWFLLRYDRQTISIVHLSQVDKRTGHSLETHRDLIFFTNGISDLYSKRDDLADDDSTESHISEYMCVSEFADNFELAQEKNYSLAAYIALRQASTPETANIGLEDLSKVLQNLQFVEVSSVLIAGSPLRGDTNDPKLLRSIKTILLPVPGHHYCFFYIGEFQSELEIGEHQSDASSEDGSNLSNEEMSKVADEYPQQEHDSDGAAEEGLLVQDYEPSAEHPIFVKFKLDGRAVSVEDLMSITKSGVLITTVSLFKDDNCVSKHPSSIDYLPWSHRVFSVEVTSLLKSYVAEQTLGRLEGTQNVSSEENLQLIRKCLSRIQSVVSFAVEIYLYISRQDLMMPAAAPAGGEAEVEEGFLVLERELIKNGDYTLNPLSGIFFFVSGKVGEEAQLKYWCLLNVQKGIGSISVQIYHPDGESAAMLAMTDIHDMLCKCIHRANQQLLLRSLHRTRTASEFIIPSKPYQESQEFLTSIDSVQKFSPGVFECPVVFRITFDLYQRAATNPGQVARTLEATVLHNFAVSNRSGIFVYKDESDAIFYMKIVPVGSGIDADGKVELVVHGVEEPGPSVTEQLCVLLQRRLLLIAVDMLSAVLTKNPHFKWKQADISFLRTFDKEWQKLDKDKGEKSDRCRFYEFPLSVTDPCMVLIFFRQNICGSTFFHRLNDIDQNGSNPSPAITDSTKKPLNGGKILNMNKHEFTLYFNYNPSKLEPAFQGESTLTTKGKEYCRQTGSGIAMIEYTLMKSNEEYLEEVHLATPVTSAYSTLDVPLEEIRMKRIVDFPEKARRDCVCVRVKVTDTALNRNALQEWICLTLNQALVGWVAERLIARAFYGRFKQQLSARTTLSSQQSFVDAIYPGLPALQSILETSNDLPHSAISRFDGSGIMRSSSVASHTLALLEKCIFGPLVEKNMIIAESGNELSKKSLLEKLIRHIRIIRVSRRGKPRIARLTWSEAGRRRASVSIVSEDGSLQFVQDSPIDCPEYICIFSLSERDYFVKEIESELRLYREVNVHDGISERSESIKLLDSIKEKFSDEFIRSFAFILTVKRNKRCLLTYNWHPKFVKSCLSLLRDAENAAVAESGRSSHMLQRRTLGGLCPSLVDSGTKGRVIASQKATKPEKKASFAEEVKVGLVNTTTTPSTGPGRRIRRPTAIRRPKLIGKSVEGAAMQAMAANREKASIKHLRNRNGSAQGIKIQVPTPPSKDPGARAKSKVVKKTNSFSERLPARGVNNRHDGRDEILARVRIDYDKLCSIRYRPLLRLSSLQEQARFELSRIWWPVGSSQPIPCLVAHFLTSVAPKAWNDICPLPPLPGGIFSIFIPTLARWVVALTPGLDLVMTSMPSASNHDSILIRSAVRNVHYTKCCVVAKISLIETGRARSHSRLVKIEGWVLNLPRRSKAAQLWKPDLNKRNALTIEKDSAGMDKLLTDVHRSLGLERLLFDFSASMVERAVRLLDERIKFEDLVPTVRELMRRYPYEQQKRIPRLNYRAFEATMVLKSYNDRLLDMFDSKELFRRLSEEAGKREIMKCGDELCFKKSISVKGCHSICFITLHPTDVLKMKLVFLCRTQGVNLADFMFRKGSNVAIHILDYIAFEGAGLALKELHYVAECLLKDSLWKALSTPPVSRKKETSKKLLSLAQVPASRRMDLTVNELLKLAHVCPLLRLPGINLSAKGASGVASELHFLFSRESGIDWMACCHSMNRSNLFSLQCAIEEKGIVANLFYVKKFDVFFRLIISQDSQLLSTELIEKDQGKTQYQQVLEAFINYLLHFIWHNL